MKKLFIAILTAVLLLLTACTAPASLSAEELERQAGWLTEHLINYAFNYTAKGEKPKETVEAPEILCFVLLTCYYNEGEDTTDGEYRYSRYYTKEEYTYYYDREKVQRQVYEVFGISDYVISTELPVAYNEELDCYESGLEFGIGQTLSCTDVVCHADLEDQKVTASFELHGSKYYPDTGPYGKYNIEYTICAEEQDSFLRFEKMWKA